MPRQKIPIDIAALAAEYAAGATLAELARRHGVGQTRIHQRLTEAGVPMRPRGRETTLDQAAIRAEYEAGATSTALAARYGVNQSTIRSAILAAGGTMRPAAPRLDLDAARIRSEYEAGTSAQALARRYGVSNKTILDRVVMAGGHIRSKAASLPATAEDLRREYEAGMSLHDLGARHGVSAWTIAARIKAAGGRLRPRGTRIGAARARRLRTEYEAGASLRSLALRAGLPQDAIRAAIISAGGTIRTRSTRPAGLDPAVIRAEYEAGASALQLARRYGVSTRTIAARIHAAGGALRSRQDATRIAERAVATGPRKPRPDADAVCAGYRAGLTMDALAERHGTSRTMIREVLERALGQTPRQAAQARVARIDLAALRAGYEAGDTIEALAERYGIGRTATGRLLRQAGCRLRSRSEAALWAAAMRLPPPPRPPRPPQERCGRYRSSRASRHLDGQALRRAHEEEGLSLSELARRHGVAQATIRRRILRAGGRIRRGQHPKRGRGGCPVAVPAFVTDAFGELWRIKREVDTDHGWPLLYGYPVDKPGTPSIILTPELVGYLEQHRLAPWAIRLPLGDGARMRLRRRLGHHWLDDTRAWWRDRAEDLAALSTRAFAEKHGVLPGTAAAARRLLMGPTQPQRRPLTTEEAALILSNTPIKDVARALGRSAAAVRALRSRLRPADSNPFRMPRPHLLPKAAP